MGDLGDCCGAEEFSFAGVHECSDFCLNMDLVSMYSVLSLLVLLRSLQAHAYQSVVLGVPS